MERFSLGKKEAGPPQWESYRFESLFIAKFKRGEFLFVEGQPIENVFLIKSGKTKVFLTGVEGRTLLVCFRAENSLLGEVEMILHSSAMSSIQAVTDVVCYAVSKEEFLKTAMRRSELMGQIAWQLAERTRTNTYNMSANILYGLEMRLCAYIEQTQHEGLFVDNLSALSDLLGTSYRHLHHTLHLLCEKGILQKHEKGYRILDMEALSKAAGGMYRL